jgi:hypothetical protein
MTRTGAGPSPSRSKCRRVSRLPPHFGRGLGPIIFFLLKSKSPTVIGPKRISHCCSASRRNAMNSPPRALPTATLRVLVRWTEPFLRTRVALRNRGNTSRGASRGGPAARGWRRRLGGLGEDGHTTSAPASVPMFVPRAGPCSASAWAWKLWGSASSSVARLPADALGAIGAGKGECVRHTAPLLLRVASCARGPRLCGKSWRSSVDFHQLGARAISATPAGAITSLTSASQQARFASKIPPLRPAIRASSACAPTDRRPVFRFPPPASRSRPRSGRPAIPRARAAPAPAAAATWVSWFAVVRAAGITSPASAPAMEAARTLAANSSHPTRRTTCSPRPGAPASGADKRAVASSTRRETSWTRPARRRDGVRRVVEMHCRRCSVTHARRAEPIAIRRCAPPRSPRASSPQISACPTPARSTTTAGCPTTRAPMET